jgi:hypothetical protein
MEVVLTGNTNQMVLPISQKQKRRGGMSPLYGKDERVKRTRWRGWRGKRLEERARAGPEY